MGSTGAELVEGSQSWVREVFNALREPMFVLDSSKTILFANQAFHELIGAPGGELPTLAECCPGLTDELLRLNDFACELHSTSKESFTAKLETTRLSDHRLLARIVALSARGDTPAHRHNQRLETLGLLAGGVAHDFNNVLTGILGHLTYLRTILPQTGIHVESLMAIEEGSRKAAAMTQQILNFTRLEPQAKPVAVDVVELTRKSCLLLRGAISREFQLEPTLPSRAHYVLGIEGQITQVIINLAVNARDALERGGYIRVSVSTESDRATLEQVLATREPPARSYVRLRVEDNGHGMSPEVVARIFEPYFSTKKGKGTGLGLATVQSIVQGLGGAISVDSRPGHGTTIEVFLPELERGVDNAKAEEPRDRKRVAEPGARILIVDDEHAVRNVLELSLKHLGYTVTTAPGGPQALELYTKPGAFDLVLMDMLMPVMTGDVLFGHLRERDPAAKVLVMSGFASEAAIQKVLDTGGIGFLQKPFTIKELQHQVELGLREGDH